MSTFFFWDTFYGYAAAQKISEAERGVSKALRDKISKAFTGSPILYLDRRPKRNMREWWMNNFEKVPDLIRCLDIIPRGNNLVFHACSFEFRQAKNDIQNYVPILYQKEASGLPIYHVMYDLALNKPNYSDYRKAEDINYYLSDKERFRGFEMSKRYNHALLNLSGCVKYSEDGYHTNVLAKSHHNGECIYIPNMANEAKEGKLGFSIADIQTLGMASLLLIPITMKSNAWTSMVLMLWSPIPNRWDRLMKAGNEKNRVELSVKSSPIDFVPTKKIVDSLKDMSEYFSLLKSYETIRAYDTYRLLESMDTSSDTNQDSSNNDRVTRIMHKYDKLVYFLTQPSYKRKTENHITVYALLERLLLDSTSVIRTLSGGEAHDIRVANKEEFMINLTYGNKNATIFYRDIEKYSKEKYMKLKIDLGESMITPIALSPIDNLKKYADALIGIDIEISKGFLCLRFRQRIKEKIKHSFIEDKDGFYKYYSVRRGLPVVAPESSLGLGNIIFKCVGYMLGCSKKLHISSDGTESYDEIWLPILHESRVKNIHGLKKIVEELDVKHTKSKKGKV
ncbi:MAG: hypothetical protein JWQ09_3563 [Segetibacter sp.]|nr:hypothetical protein [Segetibacter sp.]